MTRRRESWGARLGRRLRTIGRVVGFGALVAGIVGAGAIGIPVALGKVIDDPYFAVSEIVIRGQESLERDDVLDAGNLHIGMSLWRVSPAETRANIETLARVQRAAVRREFPGRVVVSVEEREPMAIAVVEGLHYLDRSGQVIGTVGAGDSVDFPFVTGIDGSHISGAGQPLLRRAMRLIRLCERRHCGGGVSEVHLDSERGLVFMPRGAPVPVLMGWGGWRRKLDRMERVLAAWEGQQSRLAAVDVTLRRSVVVKLREQPPAAARQKTHGLAV